MNEHRVLQVTFYTKAGCSLCDEARELLNAAAAEIDYELTEIDIRKSSEIFERYRYRIPVIVIDNQEVLEGRFELPEVETALGQN